MPEQKPSSVAERKNRLKKLLHVGRRELRMDEDTYRALLVSISKDPKRTSSAQLTLNELDQALDRMKAGGFKVRAARADRPQDKHATSRKIRSLWLSLRDLGALNDPSEKALAAFIKNQTGVEDLAWLDGAQAAKVIESLKKWVKRVEKQNVQA